MSDPQTPATFLAPDIADLAPLFPGYEIECLIATGGMGAVYRAVQKSLDRTVAIKILPHEFSNDAAFCAGFEAEAKAMARLNHPNLIGVYDFGEVNGMLYIIMEFVPGKSVFHSAHGIAIDPREVTRLVTGICNGLSHAHENGILHRDIKPSNILLDLNAQPKIGDFGLARPIGTKVQEGEEIFGTPHYTAPEVVNSPHSVDYRADIFSVGVMLHELLTGKLPAEDQRPASAIVHCDPRFDAIVRRATNPLPNLRYASAAEIAKDLQAIANSSGPKVAAARTPAAKGPPRPVSGPGRSPAAIVRRQKSSSSLPGIVLLLLVVIAGIGAYLYFSGSQPAPQAPEVTTPSTTPKDSREKPAPHTISPVLPDDPTPSGTTNITPPPPPLKDPVKEPSNEPAVPTDPKPEPPPVTDTSSTPKFDVNGFFEKARKAMQDRANPLITKRDASLIRNVDDYERGLKRLVRKLDFGKTRDTAESTLELYIQKCRDEGNRIPEKIDDKIKTYRAVQDLNHFSDVKEEFIEKQTAIDGVLTQALSQLSGYYVAGLEKQNQRLKTENDPAAAELIQQEIDSARNSESYFSNLMLGIDPTQGSEKGDGAKGAGKNPLGE